MKKILAVFLLFAIYYLLTTSNVFAAGWVDKSYQEFGGALDKARGDSQTGQSPMVNKEGWVFDTFSDSIHSMNCMIIGLGCTNKTDKQSGYFRNSAVSMTGSLIASMYANPPASTYYYAYDLLQNAGFAKKAYAQGVGFSGLTPILPLWKAFRNIAYMILVIVLIAIGFMIMFRMKIDPQTVISVQNALPKIVVTLILITFSYAIAGLLIDLMYLLIMLSVAVIGQSGLLWNTTSAIQQDYLTGGTLKLFTNTFGLMPLNWWTKAILGGVSGPVGGKVFPILMGITNITGGVGGFLLGGLMNALIGGITGGISGGIAGLFMPIFVIIIAIALLFAFVRIFFQLLSAYIQIIIGVIFAPLQILFGAIPGKGGFEGWFRGILANILIFPTTATLLIIGQAITRNAKSVWTPPILVGGSGDFVIILIGLGMVLFIPSLNNSIKEALSIKPVLPIGTGGVIFAPTMSIGTGLFDLWRSYHMYGGRDLIKALRKGKSTPGEKTPEVSEEVSSKVKNIFGAK